MFMFNMMLYMIVSPRDPMCFRCRIFNLWSIFNMVHVYYTSILELYIIENQY